MGKKSERIEELTTELEATKVLLRGVGDSVGVVIDGPVTMADIPRLTREFADGLRAGAPRSSAAIASAPRRKRSVADMPWDTFDEHVDEAIDRLDEQGLTRKEGGEAPGDDPLSVIADIARELGIVGDTPGDTIRLIRAEIVRLKNGGDIGAPSSSTALTKGDTLSDVFTHAHDQNRHLRDETQQARTVLGRIAAVMQVDRWDADGTQILERAQVYEAWKHALKLRIKDLLATGSIAKGSGADVLIAEELQAHLDKLMTARELSDWNKARSTWVKRAAAAVAAAPLIAPYPFTFRNSDLAVIRHAMVDDEGVERRDLLSRVLSDIGDSVVSTDELVRFLNRDILPILARQRAAQRLPETGSATTETSGEIAVPKMSEVRHDEVTSIPVIKE